MTLDKILKPIRDQLSQGANPKGLAFTCAVGVAMGIFPLLGVTTGLCVLVGIRFKLNQPILQTVNYLMYPLQLLLIPVFIYAGTSLFGTPVSINPKIIVEEFKISPSAFFERYGLAGLEGVLVWCVVAPILSYGVYLAVFSLLKNWKVKNG